MREIIANRLWIGNALEGRDMRLLLGIGIEAILDLAIEELPSPPVRELIYCRVPLSDGASNRQERLKLAIESLASLVEKEIPTFVFCGAGMSRSPAVTAAALSVVEKTDPIEMLQKVVAGHPHDVSPALWQDVIACIRSSA